MFDVLIRNGNLVDGTGAPARPADIGIQDGRITAIGHLREPARRTIDAEGRAVAPGFIDVHTHYDAQVFWDPTLSPSSFHGVTTVFGGNCGFSIAPLSKETAPYLLRMLARVEGMPEASLQAGVPWDWQSFGDYLGRIEGKVALNAGFMAGHCAVRCAVMGERARGFKANPDELARMKALLARSLAEGAMGFSTSTSTSHNDADGEPVPSRHADRDEVVALAGVCRDFPGTSIEIIPSVHAFGEYETNLMTDMALAAQRAVNWNTLAVQVGNEDVIENRLAASDYARARGARVLALTTVIPATLRLNFHSGFVFDFLDGWDDLFKLPVPERIAFLKDPERRRELDRRARSEASGTWQRIALWHRYTVSGTRFKEFEGKSIAEIAKRSDETPFDAMLDLAIAEDLRTIFALPSEANDDRSWARRSALWRDKRTVIGASDAGAHLDMLDAFAYSTRLLEASRDRSLLGLEEAVHHLTERPARLLGLTERGLLKPGFHADVVLFDPAKVGSGEAYVRSDLPGGEMRLYADAHGIDHVIVNGTPIIEKGVHTGALPGTVLRSGRDTETSDAV